MTAHSIVCPKCGQAQQDAVYGVHCVHCGKIGPRIEYSGTPVIRKSATGLDRYAEFLLGDGVLDRVPNPVVTYQSRKFADKLGMNRLYITLTGYAPEHGAYSPTCSFKELEAIAVFRRLMQAKKRRVLILSSAGNTARAFCYWGAKFGWPVVIVVPVDSRQFIWLPHEPGLLDRVHRYVRVVSVGRPSSYRDAAVIHRHIADLLGTSVADEGGFGNPGRLAGLGIAALSFFDITGCAPDKYFQAVGSAAGAVAASRIYQQVNPEKAAAVEYFLMQNEPYTPLVDALNQELSSIDTENYQKYVDMVCAPMLTSADPLYAYPGGLKDDIRRGIRIHGVSVNNDEIYEAQYNFYREESLEVLLPAAAAIAGLSDMIKAGRVHQNDLIHLNVTGVGESRRKADSGYFFAPAMDAPVSAIRNDGPFEDWFHGVFEPELALLQEVKDEPLEI